MQVASGRFELFDRAVGELAEGAVAFLERLLAAPSTLGSEELAQEVVADELARLRCVPPRGARDDHRRSGRRTSDPLHLERDGSWMRGRELAT